jgi:hypothetical protein
VPAVEGSERAFFPLLNLRHKLFVGRLEPELSGEELRVLIVEFVEHGF